MISRFISATLVAGLLAGTASADTLREALVSSYQTGGHGSGGVVPTCQFSLNFARIEFEYREQKADGSLGPAVKTGYCLKSNKKV